MSTRIRNHIRSNIIGYVALFVALGGTAVALPGTNSVDSGDIINQQVKSIDIANEKVNTNDLQDNQVASSDVRDDTLTNGGLGALDLAPNSVGSSEVADNSLGGSDIDESTLSGLGANDGYFGICDPGTTTFIDCASTTISLGRTMNVLVIADTHFNTFSNTAPAWGNCRLERNDAAVSNDHPIGELDATEDTQRTVHQGGMNLVDVQTLGAGTYQFEISCNQIDSDVEYPDQRIAVVKLAQD
ncbi:MAG TPA: hypothetical protein VHR37_04130 [Solirubrobacterales bacterium]|jgi:hypothetical protein|nr:hypothetical protein [Solirubrobacterales bacterium]